MKNIADFGTSDYFDAKLILPQLKALICQEEPGDLAFVEFPVYTYTSYPGIERSLPSIIFNLRNGVFFKREASWIHNFFSRLSGNGSASRQPLDYHFIHEIPQFLWEIKMSYPYPVDVHYAITGDEGITRGSLDLAKIDSLINFPHHRIAILL